MHHMRMSTSSIIFLKCAKYHIMLMQQIFLHIIENSHLINYIYGSLKKEGKEERRSPRKNWLEVQAVLFFLKENGAHLIVS